MKINSDMLLFMYSVRYTVSNQGISLFYGFIRRFETDIDVLRAFVGGLEELCNSLQAVTPPTSAFERGA